MVDHDTFEHERACFEAFLRSSPQKLVLIDFDEGHVAVYNNTSEAVSMAKHILVFSNSHQYKFKDDVLISARSSLSLWFGRGLKALASPQHQSYHWDFDPPVPNRLTLTLDGVELASIDKVNIEREYAQMNEEATLGKRNRRVRSLMGVKYLRSGGRYARKVRIKSTEPKAPK